MALLQSSSKEGLKQMKRTLKIVECSNCGKEKCIAIEVKDDLIFVYDVEDEEGWSCLAIAMIGNVRKNSQRNITR